MISILTQIDQRTFSSELDCIAALTDQPTLDVVLNDNDEGIPIFSTVLYAYNGRVTLRNIREIVEDYMLSVGTFAVEMMFSFITAQETVYLGTQVIYAQEVIAQSFHDFQQTRFLTSLQSKVTFPGVPEYLYSLIDYTIDWEIHYVSSTGQELTATAQTKSVGTGGVEQFDVSYSKALSLVPAATIVRFYRVSVNRKEFSFFVDHSHPDLVLMFRNIFGLVETFAVKGHIKKAADTEREVAIINHKRLHYDIRNSRTYEVETAPIPTEMADWIDQICLSKDVRCYKPTYFHLMPEVLVTDFSSDLSNSDDEHRRISFKWEFASDIPHQDICSFAKGAEGNLLPQLPSEGTDSTYRIFSDQFNFIFS